MVGPQDLSPCCPHEFAVETPGDDFRLAPVLMFSMKMDSPLFFVFVVGTLGTFLKSFSSNQLDHDRDTVTMSASASGAAHNHLPPVITRQGRRRRRRHRQSHRPPFARRHRRAWRALRQVPNATSRQSWKRRKKKKTLPPTRRKRRRRRVPLRRWRRRTEANDREWRRIPTRTRDARADRRANILPRATLASHPR
jgi:hypothetical protein